MQEHLAPDGAGTLGRYAWRHAYDALGNRTDSRMPGGRHVQWLYYGSGHLHQIRVDGHVLSDIERDALHQEIERTQGALESRYGWDPMGRLVAHKVGRRQALKGQPGMPSPQALRDRDQGLPAWPQLPSGDRIARQYRYDPTGNLIATRDGLRGDSHYRYDPLGRILAAQRGDGKQQATERETFAFDPAGNLLNPNRGAGPQASGGVGQRDVVPHNRLAVYQDLRFAYDLHGNVTERRIGWHTVQHYRYSPEHQIVEARVVRYRDRPAEGQAEPTATEQVTHYRYDALGRRIEKRDAFGRTAFLYDGDLLAGELRGSKLSEYLYEPDSFVPLAKLESEWKGEAAEKEGARPKDFAAYYYQCDQIGAPQELTDEQGRIVWAASYRVWGQTQALQVMRTGTDAAAVFTAAERPLALAAKGDIQALSFVEQPLRFQGQYFDGETGLHYNRFRYYDPVTGRFVHQDPIGLFGGGNPFIYGPNTSSWIDPSGLIKTPQLGAPTHSSRTSVRRVNGRFPINRCFAGKTMTGSDLPENVRGKYPHGVPFNMRGFPDFSRYALRKADVGSFTTDYNDFKSANEAAFGKGNPFGASSKITMNGKEYTWHHTEKDGQFQLIPKDIHDAVKHTGGAAVCNTRK
ncbi:RHS domain-containing protein [Acidovorax sp. NCPPB 3859]|nr:MULTISPECIES: RHS repeat-associated core domain-containing protein [unclassified Acidovorax]MDA8451534.1 RHS domain-containing protein [Acidovorax sp. GBBC 3297]MDA8461070.1 RHS domain-containing protein [Acidovorax sp. GBBC 3333]MDA8466104.1 RHS domain-containing protein [Acidovorax sp. GBBC 3332]MDA8471140.1 RHS domain-containing protein [Acidovorax sp. GBBC 3299]WCM77353.1 RHS domain-containing protein [Acidovorax sp. GBBC 712]